MKIENKKIGEWDAIVFTDKDDVCITLQSEGGAVIGAKTYKDAEVKFLEAMSLSDSIRKLLYFKKYGKFTA